MNDAEPVFAEPWEAQAFALAVALQERGAVHGDRVGRRRSAPRSPPDRRTRPYYEHWLAALESLLAAKGLADADTLARCRDAWARAAARTPHGAPIELAPDDR